MDRHLKERLTGAAVLILLGVWLIPIFLDGKGLDSSFAWPIPIPIPFQQKDDEMPLKVITLDSDRSSPLSQNPNWLVEVGSYEDQYSAENQKEKVASRGFNPVIMNYEDEGTYFYRVMVASVSEEEADSILAQLILLGFEAQVVER